MISEFHSRLFSYVQISRFSVMIWTRAAAMVILFTLLISEVAGQNTSFAFNSTSGINDLQGAPMFTVSGDAVTDVQGGKFLALNNDIAHQTETPAKPNCGRVVYKDKVRLRDKTNSVVASFHTSFTFSFASFDNDSNSCGQGMLFMFSPNSIVSASETNLSGPQLCALNRTQTDLRLFAVEIDSQFNPLMSDKSDSHISLDVGNRTLSTHDLCHPANTNQKCSFFCKDPNAKYTAWIDYDSANQKLQVWFRNGSGVTRPTSVPDINYSNLSLDKMLDDEMYVGFIGSTRDRREVHTIWAWEFATTGTTSKSGSKISMRLIVGISAGAIPGLLVVGIIVYFVWDHRKSSKAQAFYELPSLSFQDESRSYTFKELSEMTKGFSASEKLSSGACGDVYKGTLPSGGLVAVKRIKEEEELEGERSFLAEVRSLRQTRHRDLLQLRGWSYSTDGMFLVYEFMCNGSLNKWLHPNGELNWDVRRAILAGVASGLEYLHEDGMKCVLHRDIKSDNVLLDADFNPYLGDFGLARLVDHRRTEKTTMVAGTLGYMAPEMLKTIKATKETDVYAFGVLALEVATGRKPTRMQDKGGLEMLVDSVWRAHETGSLEFMVDPRLGDPRNNQEGNQAGNQARDQGIHDEEKLELEDPGMYPERVLKVGLLCCLPDPSHRPSMRLVNQWFQSSSERMDMVLPELPEVQPRSMPLFLENSEASTSFNDVSSSFSSNLSGSAMGGSRHST